MPTDKSPFLKELPQGHTTKEKRHDAKIVRIGCTTNIERQKKPVKIRI